MGATSSETPTSHSNGGEQQQQQPSRQNDVIDMTSDSQTPMRSSTEVIEISTTPPKQTSNSNNASNAAVKIKKDPAAAAAAKMSITMDDSDSDVEILSPSRFPRRPGSSSSTNNNTNNDNDMETDEIQVTGSTMTNPNIDLPHMRHQCGVHSFTRDVATNGFLNNNDKSCAKCYCFVCDSLASECKSWNVGSSRDESHCHAHDKDAKWVQMKEKVALKVRGVPKKPESHGEVTTLVNNPYNSRGNRNQPSTSGMMQEISSLIHNEFLDRLIDGNSSNTFTTAAAAAAAEAGRQRVRERKDMRITEVLLENFRKAVKLQESAAMVQQRENTGSNKKAAAASSSRVAAGQENDIANQQQTLHQKMEGDIPTLSLHNSFFVQGVKIGWPFPEIMKPQRQMAVHLIKALKEKKHVVLESPTGTGKSAAILCSVLAWQRHHFKMERMKRQQQRQQSDKGNSHMRDDSEDEGNEGGGVQKVKIIYCSRTHSQVAQMVASLKNTPYRPRMAILGSRERLCIHKSIKPRGQNADAITGVNVNNECRLRVRNTEKSRKHQLANPNPDRGHPYNDDDPPDVMPGDGDAGGGGQQDGGMDDGPDPDGGDNETNQSYIHRSRTCPHYRQLSTSRVANLAHSTFVPNNKVDCCSVGGKKSKYGAHDIEDLVNFGVDPYLLDVALYRREATESIGLSLKSGSSGGCFVQAVRPNTPAEINGTIMAGDKIVRVNGNNVSTANPATVVGKIKDATSDPLMMDVSRGGSGSLTSSGESGGYSSRAACPYYLSHVLQKDADIVFAPYNYVLDPGIREALSIELDNSVVILDEAHNVESTLREAGSGKFSEFELCELIVMLNNYAVMEKTTSNMMDVAGEMGLLGSESETEHLCNVAHTLLIFVEKVVNKLRTSRICFEKNPGAKGAARALQDWEKFHSPDDTEFEVTFDGPTGKGHNGKCVGCLPFFEKMDLKKEDLELLERYVDAFEKFFRGEGGNDASPERDRISNLVDQLKELVHKLNAAIQTPEHYYAAVLATANGSLEFANGGDGESENGGRRPKRKPRALPLIDPRTPAHPNRPANPCTNKYCRERCTDVFSPVRHGDCCNGSTPKWEGYLHLDLLTPGPLMQQLAAGCRTVVLASGSLAPISSLCAELNLFPADGLRSPVRASQLTPTKNCPPSQPDPTNNLPKIQKRLQNHPMPLEAGHVIDLEKQLFAVSCGHFPDGSELKVSQKNYKHADFLPKLGDAIVRIVEGIPEGGVLVFLPSYALLRKCERLWNPNGFRQNSRRGWWTQNEPEEGGPSVWDRLKAIKHKVIVEPSGSQDLFEEKKQEYMDSVRTHGGCVLLAVYRGKMSEGISFNDNNARGVICIGLPLPSAFALPIKSKIAYNDEQRNMRQRTDLLPGREWYNQQAYRAIAQALGRCIRHVGDYGAIFLLDIRHCDDGSPNDGIPTAHKNLPRWMRAVVKNLSKRSTGRRSMFNHVSSSSSILGGWPGLKTDLQRFFRNAKPYANGVLKAQQEKMAAASTSGTVVHTFNARTNKWSEKKTKSTPPNAVPASSPCQSNGSSNSINTSLKQTSLSTSVETKNKSSDNNGLFVIDRQTSKPSSKQSQGSARKKGTIQEMFKKQQQETEGSNKKGPPASSSKAAKKVNNTPKTLKTMFEKQRAASASPVPPAQETIEVEQEGTATQPASDADPTSTESSSQPIASTNEALPGNAAPQGNAFTFKRSPFVNDMLTPTTEVAASTSQLVLSQSQAASASQLAISQSQACSTAEDERLCVVCEDGKKEILLLPCNHMCLCKNCADTCLFKTIKQCPMCRGKITGSTPVFW
ncbi:hypothetical protein ACHAXR_010746 [Thalassiosira sp. AJA248-18]